MEQKYIQTAIDYKKNIAGKFVLVEGAKLKQRVEGEHYSETHNKLCTLFQSEQVKLVEMKLPITSRKVGRKFE